MWIRWEWEELRIFPRTFRKLAASTLCKGMFDKTITLQRSSENSCALPSIDELCFVCFLKQQSLSAFQGEFSVYASFVFSSITMLFYRKMFFSDVTFTSHNLQNKIMPSAV